MQMIGLTHIQQLPLVQRLRELASLDQILALPNLSWREVPVAEGDPGWLAELDTKSELPGWTLHLARPAMLEAHRHGWAAGLPYGEREVIIQGCLRDLDPKEHQICWPAGSQIIHAGDTIHQPVVVEDSVLLVHQPAGLWSLLHSHR